MGMNQSRILLCTASVVVCCIEGHFDQCMGPFDVLPMGCEPDNVHGPVGFR
jgi:hypothetical protein